MVTALYASILALFMCWLSMQVIKARRKYQVRYADGGVKPVIIARTAQQNAYEYIPVSLILMVLLEYNSQQLWLIHLLGILLCVARITHARAILTRYHAGRVLGMKLTFGAIVLLAISNLVFLPYANMI
jgi:hypothetical protein